MCACSTYCTGYALCACCAGCSGYALCACSTYCTGYALCTCSARYAWVVLLSLLIAVFAVPLTAQTPRKISTDNFTNSDSDHKTEVEPSSFAWGSTIVSAFHVARRPSSEGWGSADVGFATSTNGGKTWKYGNLPGLTVNYEGGSYGAASDPSGGQRFST